MHLFPLHNMLLEVDGLDAPWNDGVKQPPTSDWTGSLGNLDIDDVPTAIRELMSPADIRAYDTSSLGLAGPSGLAGRSVRDEDVMLISRICHWKRMDKMECVLFVTSACASSDQSLLSTST